MKKILFVLFVFSIGMQTNVFSLTRQFNSRVALEDRGDGTPRFGEYFETVQIECHGDRCELVCRDPGISYLCCWLVSTWCDGCDPLWDFFQAARGNEMFDQAIMNINMGFFNGVFNSNIINEPLGKIYYRAVSWSTDILNFEATIDITITEGN